MPQNNNNKKNTRLTGDAAKDEAIRNLVSTWNLGEHFADDFSEMIGSLYKLSQQDISTGDTLLFQRSLGELRYAQQVFAPYRGKKKIGIFGSARTVPEHPAYQCAKEFAAMMKEVGYMTITGAGEGIMGAAQRGAGADYSFGLNIRLPFEQHPNEVIIGDPKLVTFRYFFTRKLTFLREASAIALFPGGFGTLDEGFEALTLVQTGKARVFPMVFIEEEGGTFWQTFMDYLRGHLLKDKLVSEQDFHLFKITQNLAEARDEVTRFYRIFHSYRFVDQDLIIRLNKAIPQKYIEKWREEFKHILFPNGTIEACSALPQEANETDIKDLPRLRLAFDRHQYGNLRLLIDAINNVDV